MKSSTERRAVTSDSEYLAPPDCPTNCLCHSPSKETVARLVNEHVEHPWSHHAVYVLACRPRSLSAAKKIAIQELRDTDGERVDKPPRWVTKAANSEWLFYVGLSKQLVECLHRHAHGTGRHFTRVFPATRLVDVDWYPTLADSYREKPVKAREVQQRIPDAFVSTGE